VSLDEMAADADDMGLAWHYWVRERDLERIDQLVDSLWLLYDARGWLHAAIELATDLLDVLASTPDTGERAEQQIALQLSLARVLQAAKGFTTEVQDAYGRALELIRRHGSVPRLYPALRGLATFHMYRGEMVKAASYAREILDLAEQQDDRGMTVEGRLLLGATVGFWGDPRMGLDHLERAIADPGPVRQRRFRFGTSPLVACHTTSAFIHWLMGHPDRALDRATGALELARRLDHPFTTAYAQFHSGVLHMWRREPEILRDRGMAVLAIAGEHDFQIWTALGTCLVGSATTALGRTEEGLARIHEGLELYRGLRTPPVFWPMLLQLEAGALASAGQAAAGLAVIGEGIGYIGEGETVVRPEFLMMRGDLLMALPDRDQAAAEADFQAAHDIAERIGVRMSRLRAATRLCRLWTDARDPARGQRVLRPVFDAFTEGFDTLDLLEAKEALGSAGAHDLA
jgi:tetratricopeptide (TPR) repeat protein